MTIIAKVSDPIWKGGGKLFDLQQLNEYTHTIASFGGYDTCDFSISATGNEINDWLSNGLGRDIQSVNETGEVWNGFVNTITIQSGEKTLTIGPLTSVINKLHLVYAPKFQHISGQEIIGSETYLDPIEDTTSQEKYGTMERVLVNSKTTQSSALQSQSTKLQDFKNPRETERQSPLSTTGNLVVLNCKGYHNYLNYPYSDTTIGLDDLSVKIASILASEPNTIFNSDTTKITENTTQVLLKENKTNGYSLIKSLITSGDASDNRYIFGIYNNRQAKYELAPTAIEYKQSGSSNNAVIEKSDGSIVRFENILAGKWIRYSDLLIGKNQPVDIRESQNSIFIEKVRFISPKTVIINGELTANDGAFQGLMLRGITV